MKFGEKEEELKKKLKNGELLLNQIKEDLEAKDEESKVLVKENARLKTTYDSLQSTHCEALKSH